MKKMIVLFVVAALVEFAFVGIAKAADSNMPERPKFDPNAIRGRVVVQKDANDTIISVTLENRRRGDWKIVLDEKGLELGKTMENKIVVVKGKEETKDGVKWLTVESFKELKRPQGRPGYDPNHPRRPVRPGNGPGAPGQGQQ